MDLLKSIIEKATDIAFDLNYNYAKRWKSNDESRVIIGYLPIYFPREIIHSANGISVGIFGAGDRKQIIKGDAYYQSYICRLPRGVIELVLDNHFNEFDGFLFPSICDVIRNLSGMFRILKKGKFVKYIDYPQNFNMQTGGVFFENELKSVLEEIFKINGVSPSKEKLNQSISLYNKNRRLIEEIYNIRQQFPWRLSMVDTYYLVRVGTSISVEEHNSMLEDVLKIIQNDIGEPLDNIKVVVTGAFCEQPPIGLIKTIELAGCYIVDDDFMLGSRWIEGNIEENTDEPLQAIVNAYLTKSTFSSSVYDVGNPKSVRLLNLVKKRQADGLIFASPSFCDPALLDAPILQEACDKAGVRYSSILFSENTGQFKVIKEQVGAFSDSIKLWDEPVLIS